MSNLVYKLIDSERDVERNGNQKFISVDFSIVRVQTRDSEGFISLEMAVSWRRFCCSAVRF